MTETGHVPVYNGAPIAFQSLDLNGVILAVNDEWERLTGYTAEEAVGRSYLELVPAEHLDDFMSNFASLLSEGQLIAQDCFLERKDGVERNVLIYARISDGDHSQCVLVDITDFRHTELALVESNDRFRSLFANAPTPILIHDGELVVVLNQAAATFLGYGSPDEAIGVSIKDIVAPDDLPAFDDRVKRMMTEDWVAPSTEERFVRADGTYAYGKTIAAPFVLGGQRVINVTAIDLSETKMAKEALAESEERFSTLFEFSADPIVVHDGRKALFANRAALLAFGFGEDELASGASLTDFIAPESLAGTMERVQALVDGESNLGTYEAVLLRKDGSRWYGEAKSAPITLKGRRVLQTSFRDLTERKATEAELASYRIRLEHLLAERTESLERVKHELGSVTDVVSRTVEMRDPYTAGHQRRVAALAVAIARRLEMDDIDVERLEVAARLHDVGKVSVPAELLSKPARLTDLEYELVKTHVDAGYEIALSAEFEGNVAQIIREHHERLDGSGYPRGLKGADLQQTAKVLMVADVVEAMRSHRPYRPSLGTQAAIDEIVEHRGELYDPGVVDACVAVLQDGFEFEGAPF
jgi:PAS domain S-box-containing protein/putative nucleotidyltransferase with HDIG domain